MILGGDIGGTNSRLAMFDITGGQHKIVTSSVFPSHNYAGLDKIVLEFVSTTKITPSAACFGVAGPVSNGRVSTTNLPWVVEAQRLADELKLPTVMLLNDLEATGWGIPALGPEDLVPLNQVHGDPEGSQAVLAAGTGLGEAAMYREGTRYHVLACEGGHSDFAPRDDLEIELFRYLHRLYGHVSYERILSGPGLLNVFHFLRDTGRGTEPSWLTDEMQHGDPSAAVSRAGLDGSSPLAEQALAMFVAIYGAEAGNLALKTKSTGGMFIAGGIAPKLLPKLVGPLFMHSFVAKGRMQSLLESIPVKVATNDQTALIGTAAWIASQDAS